MFFSVLFRMLYLISLACFLMFRTSQVVKQTQKHDKFPEAYSTVLRKMNAVVRSHDLIVELCTSVQYTSNQIPSVEWKIPIHDDIEIEQQAGSQVFIWWQRNRRMRLLSRTHDSVFNDRIFRRGQPSLLSLGAVNWHLTYPGTIKH